MRNSVDIKNDGINVYANFSVRSSIVGKIIMIIINILLIALLIFIASTATKSELASFIFPILIFGIIIIAFPLRYLIWNSFGKEYLIINTKTISYSYDYGVIQTNLKTKHYNRLGFDFELLRKENGIDYGKLILINYKESDNLPEIIHETSIAVELPDIELIISEVHLLFDNQLIENDGFDNYSLN